MASRPVLARGGRWPARPGRLGWWLARLVSGAGSETSVAQQSAGIFHGTDDVRQTCPGWADNTDGVRMREHDHQLKLAGSGWRAGS